MKTMMSVDGKKIIRITDEKASQLYSEGFRYVPKSMWKEQVRDVDKPSEEPTQSKSNKMSRATKRHLRKQNKNDK
jgi:hypothetical protein